MHNAMGTYMVKQVFYIYSTWPPTYGDHQHVLEFCTHYSENKRAVFVQNSHKQTHHKNHKKYLSVLNSAIGSRILVEKFTNLLQSAYTDQQISVLDLCISMVKGVQLYIVPPNLWYQLLKEREKNDTHFNLVKTNSQFQCVHSGIESSKVTIFNSC